MALQDYFVWGESGSKKTPEQLQRERKLAQAMISAGIDTSPVGHWTQGAARMANALVGNIRQGRADAAEKAGIEGAASKFAKLDLASLMGGGAYPSSVAAGASPTSAGATNTTAYSPNGSALRDGIIETAKAIGADPVDLATAISYETGGTFDPLKKGPTTKYGQHRGLIQFGEPQAQQHGVDWNDPLGSQLGANGAVANYFRSSGFKPGMSGLDLYSTINAGSPGRYSASDAANGGAPGSVADKWNNQMSGHRQKALALLGGGVDYTPTGSIAQDTPQQAIQSVSPVADPEGLFTLGADVSAADLEFARQATGPEVQPAQSNNFNDRWNAGAVDPTQTASTPAPAPTQMQPQGGPSAELLRQNDAMWGGALAPAGQAPQQAASVSGYFPPAPSANGPAMGSFTAMGQPQGGNMQRLLEAASDPWMNETQRRIIGGVIDRQLQQSDPANALDMEYRRAQINELNAKAAGGGKSTEYGLSPQYGVDANGNPVLVQLGKDGTSIQTPLPNGVKLSKEPIKLDAGTHFVLLDPITRQPIGQVPKDVAGAAAAGAEGKAQAEAKGNLPVVESNAGSILGMIDSLDSDPYLDSMLGPANSRKWNVTADAARVQSKMDQIGGQAFLQAFNSLKGGGQITEIEGQKATEAIARLNTAQSPADYRQALDELRTIVKMGVTRARQQAGVGSAKPSANAGANDPLGIR
ncbi:hypothetical protein [Brucella gallinifaecis]|uniref:hypothetical protein n=1 Tax=Brucella gallinifaecis TaxID=215590 RepID=UPI00235DE2E3|nr:hypothetical protein [Brucella gallinifaecis]